MSKFDIHKWNADRRKASLNEAMMGPAEIFKEKTLHDLQDAVDKASQLGAVNSLEKAALDTILVRAIKRRALERGDINARERGDINESYIGTAPYSLIFQSPAIEDSLRTIYDRLNNLFDKKTNTFRTNSSVFAPTPKDAEKQFNFWVEAILKDADGVSKVPYIDKTRAEKIKNSINHQTAPTPKAILDIIFKELSPEKVKPETPRE